MGTVKNIKGTGYVYYTTGHVYSPEGKRSNPVRVTIGKQCKDDPGWMIPNEKYGIYFGDRMPGELLAEPKWKEIIELLKMTSRSFEEIKDFLKGEDQNEAGE